MYVKNMFVLRGKYSGLELQRKIVNLVGNNWGTVVPGLTYSFWRYKQYWYQMKS